MTTKIQFSFESSASHGYVGVAADSKLVGANVVTQNAGSSSFGIYYQVGGGGLNHVFDQALGDQVPAVNTALQQAYDQKYGAGRWSKDSANPPNPPLLTSLLVPIAASGPVGSHVPGMVYSVGPQLSSKGLQPGDAEYAGIYTDAMTAIAAFPKKIAGFRITMLSSGIYRGGAPIAPFADAAAGCIIDGIVAAVKADASLAAVEILINTDDYPVNRQGDPLYPKERIGFTNAAVARGAEPTWKGFSIDVT